MDGFRKGPTGKPTSLLQSRPGWGPKFVVSGRRFTSLSVFSDRVGDGAGFPGQLPPRPGPLVPWTRKHEYG